MPPLPSFPSLPPVALDGAPWRLSGVVYGTLLNHRPALAALGDAVNDAPYKGAPVAPVLYQKPRNTLAADGAQVAMPQGEAALELGAALGIVIGRPACRLTEATALDHVAGYLAVADLCLPHTSYYRPSLRFRARDGFCVLAPSVTPRSQVTDADALAVNVYVDGEIAQRSSTGERVRGVAKLLADVSDFMTLSPGDILMLGVSAGAPTLAAGQRASIVIGGLAPLNFSVVPGIAAQGGAQ
jgi:5-oxopent-3-ene-1,2,5-tricarboxylate decarboxylase/2-hydroxyhepta-2,4-diene-1,7-dioate isomerase